VNIHLSHGKLILWFYPKNCKKHLGAVGEKSKKSSENTDFIFWCGDKCKNVGRMYKNVYIAKTLIFFAGTFYFM
jgi:hypothetical protein